MTRVLLACRDLRRGFTLVEVVISMGILALLAGAVYEVVSSAISASEVAMNEQLILRRLDAYLRVTRDAFLNLPAEGTVSLEIDRTAAGVTEPRLVIDKPQEIFGLPSLAGGSIVLAARAKSDGTRTMILLTIPPNATDRERKDAFTSPGVPLLPKLRKPRWTFKMTPQDQDWKEELPSGSAKPLLVRFQTEIDELPNPVEAIFYLPPLIATPPASPATSGNGTTTPAPGTSGGSGGGVHAPIGISKGGGG